MKLTTKSLLAALALATAPIAFSGQAAAQVAYSDRDAMVIGSAAFKAADVQIKAKHKVLLDQVDSKAAIANADLNALKVRIGAASKANPKDPTLEQQIRSFQEKGAAVQAEIDKMREPVDMAYAFAESQIEAKLEQAVKQAMAKKKIILLLRRDAVLQDAPGANLTPDIVAELNALLPAVSITPPPGFGQQQQGGAAAPAPARPNTQGR